MTIETDTASPTMTVIENAVHLLRGSIMAGDLRPGQKLIEADLCRELNISRASLREALRALESERLIELVPNRGPSVARLGEQEIEEIHEVWAMLTGEAVYHFTELASTKDISQISSITTRLKRALNNKNSLEQLAATNEFFDFILTRCGNRVLLDVVYSLVSRLNFLRAQSLIYAGWSTLCAEEIDKILEAIREKKPGAARRAAQRHIASACDAATHVAMQPKIISMPRKRAGGLTGPAMPRWTGRR